MFYKSQYFGQLSIERVLFEFEGEPVVFVCKNVSGARFICINTGYGFESNWIVAKVRIATLISVIRDEISVLDAVMRSGEKVLLLRDDGSGITGRRLNYEDIDPDELPDADAKVHNTRLGDYVQYLQNQDFTKNYRIIKAQDKSESLGQVVSFYDNSLNGVDLSIYRKQGRPKRTKGKYVFAEG